MKIKNGIKSMQANFALLKKCSHINLFGITKRKQEMLLMFSSVKISLFQIWPPPIADLEKIPDSLGTWLNSEKLACKRVIFYPFNLC